MQLLFGVAQALGHSLGVASLDGDRDSLRQAVHQLLGCPDIGEVTCQLEDLLDEGTRLLAHATEGLDGKGDETRLGASGACTCGGGVVRRLGPLR